MALVRYPDGLMKFITRSMAGKIKNLEKSSFFKQQIKFLGHIVTAQGLQTDQLKKSNQF